MASQGIKFLEFAFSETAVANPISPNSAIIEYIVGNVNRLEVVCETRSGLLSTYVFDLKEGDRILVYNDVIHVPVRCTSRVSGNAIECSPR
jgi:hypothetical protein